MSSRPGLPRGCSLAKHMRARGVCHPVSVAVPYPARRRTALARGDEMMWLCACCARGGCATPVSAAAKSRCQNLGHYPVKYLQQGLDCISPRQIIQTKTRAPVDAIFRDRYTGDGVEPSQ